MVPLTLKKTAPAFSLLNQKERTITLDQFKGKWVVLYFYPRAMTPGCTVQACSLRDNMAQFQKFNAVILGVSPDKPASLKKFEARDALNFTLLSDTSHKMLESYGAWQEKTMYGRKYMGVVRMTYIIDPEGKICHILPKVSPKTHTALLLEWFQKNG